ncbi:MAG: T9SS type A sorting domain-containing protein [Bacteroidetes bacterium]|nr:T9SS type A sorting domain-containing protein [Bacteroidota bacterium]
MMKTKQFLIFFLIACLSHASAQQGTLDQTFGNKGIATLDFSGEDDKAQAIVVQPDGKILITGTVDNGSNKNFGVARYHPDGSLDQDFGFNGKKQIDFFGDDDFAEAISLESDGKIIIAGTSLNGSGDVFFSVARLNPDGSYNLDFDADGKSSWKGAGTDKSVSAKDVAIDANGNIMVAGTSDVERHGVANSSFTVVRFLPDGSSTLVYRASIQSQRAQAMTLQADGKVLVAGSIEDIDPHTNFCLLRLKYRDSQGNQLLRDNDFHFDGTVESDFGGDTESAYAVAVQPDGKILVAGSYQRNANSNKSLLLARYMPDGTLDPGFGIFNGYTSLSSLSYDIELRDIVVQPDGKILVAGYTKEGTQNSFVLRRYTSNGDLDQSFGPIRTNIGIAGTGGPGMALALQSDGKVLVAGFAFTSLPNKNDFALLRYHNDVAMDIPDFFEENTSPFIYPNPVQNRFQLSFELKRAAKLDLHLFDMMGKEVQRWDHNQLRTRGNHVEEMELRPDISPGLYLLRISSQGQNMGMLVQVGER